MRKTLLIILCFTCLIAKAQDPQFSQYYNAPLLLNPAMAGATDCYRAGLNSRVQWAGLVGSFRTHAAFADLNVPDMRSGFGLSVLYDDIGVAGLSSSDISGYYSYLVPVTDQFNLRFGLQASYVSRNINYGSLLFEDQFYGTVPVQGFTIDEVAMHNRVNYMDISSGIFMYGEDTWWFGMAVHHLSRPQQEFFLRDSRLPVRLSVHGGYNFYVKQYHHQPAEEALRVVPTFLYKRQAGFQQVDFGVYTIKAPIMLGLWYRGVFVEQHEEIYQSDAIIAQAGFRYKDFAFTYSYDFTISKLQHRNTHGSHEVSIIYLFCLDWPPRKKTSRRVKRLPCPDFQRGR
ncbi:type IX secretion system membrane protein PorP/SprF [Cytophagaceae bacterium ABcell3]|nr:type IX secretion system membrane protein PorP/SprF [Cytophagaceae bacterium ABcell3]